MCAHLSPLHPKITPPPTIVQAPKGEQSIIHRASRLEEVLRFQLFLEIEFISTAMLVQLVSVRPNAGTAAPILFIFLTSNFNSSLRD